MIMTQSIRSVLVNLILKITSCRCHLENTPTPDGGPAVTARCCRPDLNSMTSERKCRLQGAAVTRGGCIPAAFKAGMTVAERERSTDRQMWDQRQNEIAVREPVASEHSSSTARSRVVTRHSGAADGATTGERRTERTEAITSTVRGRAVVEADDRVDQGDTNEDRQYNFDRRNQTSEYETDRPGKLATSSLTEEQDKRRLRTGYETDR